MTFNQRIKQAREDADLALDDVLVAVRTQLPAVLHVGRSTIGRLEKETPETKADPFLVQFLCTLYGVALDDISPVAKRALEDYAKVIDLRTEARDPENQTPDQRFGASGWTSGIGRTAHPDDVTNGVDGCASQLVATGR